MAALKKAVIFLLLLIIFSYAVYWAFFDIQRIRGQDVLFLSSSPDERYTVTAYLNNGGSTTAYSVLCDVTENQTGKRRNIYWQYRCNEAQIQWVDESTVSINGVLLNIHRDSYDFRRQ